MNEYDEAIEAAASRKKEADAVAKANRDEMTSVAKQSKEAMNSLYGSIREGADDVANKNYQSSLTSTNDTYDTSESILQRTAQAERNRTNQDADKALQQSWASYMQQKRTLPQELAAMGYTGGASETSLLGLKNAYASARGETETARMNANADTNLAEQNAIEQAESERRYAVTQLGNELRSTLQQNYADYANGLISSEQAYQNSIMSIYSIYQQALSTNHSSWDSQVATLQNAAIAQKYAQATGSGGSSRRRSDSSFESAYAKRLWADNSKIEEENLPAVLQSYSTAISGVNNIVANGGTAEDVVSWLMDICGYDASTTKGILEKAGYNIDNDL